MKKCICMLNYIALPFVALCMSLYYISYTLYIHLPYTQMIAKVNRTEAYKMLNEIGE